MNEEDPIDQILKNAADINKIVDVPGRPLPPKLLEQLNAMFPKPKEHAVKLMAVNEGKANLVVVNKRQMKLLILEKLETPMEGISIITELRKGNFQLRTNLDAAIRNGLQRSSHGESGAGLWHFVLFVLDVIANTPGEAAIYGVLREMERTGLLKGNWKDISFRMIKEYSVTDEGRALLAQRGTAIASLGNTINAETASQSA